MTLQVFCEAKTLFERLEVEKVRLQRLSRLLQSADEVTTIKVFRESGDDCITLSKSTGFLFLRQLQDRLQEEILQIEKSIEEL